MATRGVLHTVSSTGVGSSVGTGISVGEDAGDRASGGAGGRPSRLFFFLGDRAGAELGLDTEIGDGGDGGAERGLHCLRLPVSLPAFLF